MTRQKAINILIKHAAWTNNCLGPELPTDLQAWIDEDKIFDDREDKIKVLRLNLGENTTIRIWPADPDKIKKRRTLNSALGGENAKLEGWV